MRPQGRISYASAYITQPEAAYHCEAQLRPARISHVQNLSRGSEAKFPCAVMPTRGTAAYERALFMIEPRDLVFRLAAHMDAEAAIEVRVLLGENDGKMRLAPAQGVELRQHALGQRIRHG